MITRPLGGASMHDRVALNCAVQCCYALLRTAPHRHHPALTAAGDFKCH